MIFRGRLVVREWGDFTEDITHIYEEVKGNTSGANADYIPELATQDPNFFQVSACTVDGQMLNIGNCKGKEAKIKFYHIHLDI